MKTAIRLLGVLLALFAGTATGLQAQKLAPGTWTGKGVGPEGEEFPFSLEVATTGDTLSIMILGPDGERMPLSRIRFEEGKFLFTWEPGVEVNCILAPVDGGGYSGPCTDDNGGSGVLSITPPQT